MEAERPATNPFADPQIDLAPDDVAARLAAGTATLVDIRQSHERDVSRIPGSIALQMDRVAWNQHTLDWSRPVIFHCRLGWRAGLVAQAFRRIGREAYNLDGGIVAYSDAGQPIEPTGAEIAVH